MAKTLLSQATDLEFDVLHPNQGSLIIDMRAVLLVVRKKGHLLKR